ncbi:unnamed protein product [Auanema sp. JU1783]|nr:unnamed protein product [Auanema sp. JU1783]
MRIFLTLFLIKTVLYFADAQNCDRDILEDVCPQREGFDEDCERHCQAKYPLRIASGCHLRNSGTLLSLFGIRSYQCKCQLPMHFCVSTQGLNPFRQSFSLAAISTHSRLVKIPNEQIVCEQRRTKLSCDNNFGVGQCDWIRSTGADWFEATENGLAIPMMPHEKPTANYLVAVGRQGVPTIHLSTCDGLCSQGSVNVTLRMWKSPWIQAHLCFKERENLFCAPMQAANGQWTNETIPRTDNFQVYFKFTNVTEADAVMLDDVKIDFVHCANAEPVTVTTPLPQRINRLVTPTLISHEHRRISGVSSRSSLDGNGIARVLSSRTHETTHPVETVPVRNGEQSSDTLDTLKKRLCLQGECTTITHQASHIVQPTQDRTCVGRVGFMKCQEKCREQSGLSSNSRCIRQKEYPFIKRCICQVRRSPARNEINVITPKKEERYTNNNNIQDDVSSVDEEYPTLRPIKLTPSPKFVNEASTLAPKRRNRIFHGENEQKASENFINVVCGLDGDNTDCDKSCKEKDPQSSGSCSLARGFPDCICSTCFSSLCNFEKDNGCEWTDLRLISTQFNNVSIAAKKDQANRYGLTRLPPLSYSGLIRRGQIEGPIHLSVDVYPSHEIDVRICVDSFNKCQSQTVGPAAWNRISAKIKVARTEKIFLLFHNKLNDVAKTIALDNISLQNGKC